MLKCFDFSFVLFLLILVIFNSMKKSETENMLLVAYFYINLLPVIACTSKIRLGTLPGKQVDEVLPTKHSKLC